MHRSPSKRCSAYPLAFETIKAVLKYPVGTRGQYAIPLSRLLDMVSTFSWGQSILFAARLRLARNRHRRLRKLPIPSPFRLLLQLSGIAVPYDPLELVTRGAQQVQSAEERAAAMDLLARARRLSNVRLHAYDLKTSFTSYGSSSSDGRLILEDSSPAPFIYRWMAQGPGFSGIFLDVNKLLSSNRPGATMPLRLAQVRDALWNVYLSAPGPRSVLRVANGYLNGIELRCILVGREFSGNTPTDFSSGRSFDESEYCVDPKTGLLETYSPYAGLYIRFDYVNAIHFHEEIIPDGFTITEHGKAVIEDKTESVTDAAPKDSNLFDPAGLNPFGCGPGDCGGR